MLHLMLFYKQLPVKFGSSVYKVLEYLEPGMVVYAYNPSTQEVKRGGLLGVNGQPGLQNEILILKDC